MYPILEIKFQFPKKKNFQIWNVQIKFMIVAHLSNIYIISWKKAQIIDKLIRILSKDSIASVYLWWS